VALTSKIKPDPVLDLIKSMTKAEKRSFRLYATRISDSKNAKFIALFDAMDEVAAFDEAKILKKSGVPKSQLANVKIYLYHQLLTSLRQSGVDGYDDISLHEQLDFARILYAKGMYRQSLKILDRAKHQAVGRQQFTIALEIVEFEKLIESQFITRSSTTRADDLTTEVQNLSSTIQKASEFSNLAIQLYALYLKRGHVRNRNDIMFVEDYFAKHRPKFDVRRQGVHEQLYMNLSNYWYSYILQDFLACYRHTQRNVDMFTEYPMLKQSMSSLYFKSFNYLLESLFYLRHYSRFKEVLEAVHAEIVKRENIVNQNAEILARSFYYANRMNLHFMDGNFSDGLEIVPELLEFIKENENKIDQHHILVFYYKVACLYFGCGSFKQSISLLNKIIDTRDEDVRSDLQCFARILRLIATYESGDDLMMEYQVKSTYRFLVKMNDLNIVQREMLAFLSKFDTFYRSDINEQFRALHEKLLLYESMPYEKRPFLYLDLTSWLESKMKNVPVQEIIRQKFTRRSSAQALLSTTSGGGAVDNPRI
jgi:tetratricopeptide (TPR) repeat protein